MNLTKILERENARGQDVQLSFSMFYCQGLTHCHWLSLFLLKEEEKEKRTPTSCWKRKKKRELQPTKKHQILEKKRVLVGCHEKKKKKQARKPRSYASLKLRLTD